MCIRDRHKILSGVWVAKEVCFRKVTAQDLPGSGAQKTHIFYWRLAVESGGRLSAPIGVPWRLGMLGAFSTFSNISFKAKPPHAEGAETDPPPRHAYEGTHPTAW